MRLSSFSPENELERLIVEAKRGGLSIENLLERLLESDLYISSKSEVDSNGGGFEPLLLGDDVSPLVAAFSSLSRPPLHRERAAYVLRMDGLEFFRRLPAGYGVVLNPGYETQFIISCDVAKQLAAR